MEIRIVGSGCPTCRNLHKMVLKLKEDKQIDADVKYSDDIQELVELGVMRSPALVIDGEVASVGMPGNEERLLEIIKRASK